MRRLSTSLLLIVAACEAGAFSVTSDDAALAARGFVLRGRTNGARLGAWAEKTAALETPAGEAFYAVKMYGGGTVFLSGETEMRPVLAFTSATNDFSNLDSSSPLAALLARDLDARAAVPLACATPDTEGEWVSLAETALKATSSTVANSLSSVADLRVAPLLASTWSQGKVGANCCYNLYTPNHAVCGCVATAMSQLMRYHRWPTNEVPRTTHTHCYYGTSDATATVTNLTLQGGFYDWANMTLRPTAAITPAECAAIGRLTSDAGIAVEMQYTTDDGSGAYSELAAKALRTEFGYADAKFLDSTYRYGFLVSDLHAESTYQAAILSNLDAGLPVLLGIRGSVGGHAIVGDGYGYNEEALYIHLNMGWSGQDDLWYNLPKVKTSSYSFTYCLSVTYNIFPEGQGAVLSGRVVDASGAPLADATVRAFALGSDAALDETTSSSTGTYAFVLPAGTYCLEATCGVFTGRVSSVTLTEPEETLYSSAGFYAPNGSDTYTIANVAIVDGEDTIGNSWGNDITAIGYAVNLTIVCETPFGSVAPTISPSVGTGRYERGTTVTLTADAYAILTNGTGTTCARTALCGFAGSGSAPAEGTTNSVTVTLDVDTTLTWMYAPEPCDGYLRTFESFDGWRFYARGFYSSIEMEDAWHPIGTELTYALPEEASGGDAFDWTNYFIAPGSRSYTYATLTFKFAGVLLSEPGYAGDWVFDAARQYAVPTNLTFAMTAAGCDLEFVYLPTTQMWTDAIPLWWAYRHFLGPLNEGLLTQDDCQDLSDPDGDGFRNASEYRHDTDPLDSLSHAPFPFLIYLR